MCGIFGAIGRRINPGVIRALAIINRERGVDSLGFFSNTGKIIKRAGDPIGCLGDTDFADFIDKACYKGWFIAGHTRAATQGSVVAKNAHPFRYGRIIGSHNGVVVAPKEYQVDSQYLFDSLNKANGDYQSAFAGIVGYWALSWFDGEAFYLQSVGNEIALGRDKFGTYYYSSDWSHLDACVRIVDAMEIIHNGETIRFNIKCGKFERLPSFVRAEPTPLALFATFTTCRRKRGSHAERVEVGSSDPFYFDDCEGWAGVDAWETYSKQYD